MASGSVESGRSAATNAAQKTRLAKDDEHVSVLEGQGAEDFENDSGASALPGSETGVVHADSGGASPVATPSRSSHKEREESSCDGHKVSTDEGHGLIDARSENEETLRAAQRERSEANSTLSALQGALRDSQYEVARLRDMLSTRETKTRRQEDKIVRLR